MPKTRDYVNHGGLSRQAIFRAVDASLKRLGTDYIDLYQVSCRTPRQRNLHRVPEPVLYLTRVP